MPKMVVLTGSSTVKGSPFAAKRLSDLLQKLMAEYENRYGELK